MSVLVLVRHGESRWNRSNRFTGWVDVSLSEEGIREAERVAKHCKQFDYAAAFTSDLVRAQETLCIILARQHRTGVFQQKSDSRYSEWMKNSNRWGNGKDEIPVFTTTALNERYYGHLQGMNKDEAEMKFGKEQVTTWRRGYTDRPPEGETLEETHARMHEYFGKHIISRVKRKENVLVTAHGNTLRAAIKHVEEIPDDKIAFLDLPKATPLVYEYQHDRFVRIEGEYNFNRPLR